MNSYFRASYKGTTNQAVFDDLYERNTTFLKQLGKNNKHLRSMSKMSLRKQVEDLYAKYQFKTKPHSLCAMEGGKARVTSLLYIQMLSVYWNVPLIRLLTEDLSEGRL